MNRVTEYGVIVKKDKEIKLLQTSSTSACYLCSHLPMHTVKFTDLFGSQITIKRKTRKDNYEAFVEKFKPKKTTDDCFTPPEVYKVVLDYVKEKFNITDEQVVRPFWPGKDYKTFDYPKGCAVVDNPPFSILSQIVRFYVSNNIRFFLFAPHVTLLNIQEATLILVGADVVYDNGAIIGASFVTNMSDPSIRVIVDGELFKRIEALKTSRKPPPNEYPPNVCNFHKLTKIAESGRTLYLKANECAKINKLIRPDTNEIKQVYPALLVSDRLVKTINELLTTIEAEKNQPRIHLSLTSEQMRLLQQLNHATTQTA